MLASEDIWMDGRGMRNEDILHGSIYTSMLIFWATSAGVGDYIILQDDSGDLDLSQISGEYNHCEVENG
jgi:hypothetical protein